MIINQQFPPSSPLLNTDNGDDEIENNGEIKMKLKSNLISERPLNVYPTPNPSSSIGDGELRSTNSDGIDSEQENILISSPNKLHNSTPVKISSNNHENNNDNDKNNDNSNILPIVPKKRVSFNVNETREISTNENKRGKIDTKALLDSKNFKNVLKLPMDGQTINIGRSSNICQFILNSKNKLISRVHASIKYCKNENLVEVKCIGYNGINVTIPKLINVQFVKDNNYLVSIKEVDETEDEEMNQNEKNRILTRNDNFTNFYMLKNEIIKMPVVKGTVIDFRGDLILIEFGKTNEKFSNQMSTKDLENVVQNKELSFRASNNNKFKRTAATNFNDNSRPRPIEKNIMKNLIVYKNPDSSSETKKHNSRDVSDHNSNNANQTHSFEKKKMDGGILNPISKPIIKTGIENKEMNVQNLEPVNKLVEEPINSPIAENKKTNDKILKPIAENKEINGTMLKLIGKTVSKPAIGSKETSDKILKPVNKPIAENKKKNDKILEPMSKSVSKPIVENKDTNGKILKPVQKTIVENKETNVNILKPASKSVNKPIIKNKETKNKILKPINRPIKKSIIENLSVKKINQLEKNTNLKPLTMKNKENQIPLAAKIPIENNADSISKESIINNIMGHAAELKQDDAVTSAAEDSEEKPKTRGRPRTHKKKLTEEEAFNAMPAAETTSILDSIPDLEDISNLLINHLAYSRLLQTPMTQLMTLNTVKEHKLSKLHLRCILINHISCIGVIYRQGKDAAGKALDEEYYYIPEKDSDNTRVMLVKELKGSSSNLRSCRKTHKQYFWKKPKM